MKLKRLLSLAMLSIAWVGSAWADTTLLTEANDWQKVTDLSSLNLSDYYFAFVDNDKDLMLSFEEGVNQSTDIAYKTMVYRTGARAEMTPAMLWTLESNAAVSGSHMIKSAIYQDKFLQTEWDDAQKCRTHDNGGRDNSWGAWIFAYADGSWTIKNGKYQDKGYIGPFEAGKFENGREVAGNKTATTEIGHFQIYAIKRSDVDWLAAASQSNPANISYKITNANGSFNGTSGWTATGDNVEFKVNGGVGFDGSKSFFEPSMWGSGTGYNFDVTQTISSLPIGKYKLRAATQNSSGNILTMTCTDATGVYTSPAKGDKGGSLGYQGWEWSDFVYTYLNEVKDFTITFHSSASTKEQWANFDNVELYYLGKNLRDGSQSATSGVSATAGTWYAIPVNIAGNYTLTPSSGTVYYTQKGELMPDDAEAKATSVSKATNLELTAGYLYINTSEAATVTFYSENPYPVFSELYEKCKPWTESTVAGDYVATYNSYASYKEGTDYDLLNAAITYLNANFKTYAWDNASIEHPYLVEGVISGADCAANDAWPGNGRPTATGQHWSGDASRVYFTQNHEEGAARKQTVTIPNKGVYMLKTSIRPINSAAYAEISVGSETVRTYGSTGRTGGTIATDGKEYESVEAGLAAGATFANNNTGFGWIYQNLIFNTSADNETKEIKINLSNVNNSREADCGGMFLYYVGQTCDKIEDNTHYYYGNYATAPSFKVTEAVPVVDATKATVKGATVTRTNPNGLVYLASGSTADGGNNVVVDGTCANLVLADGHPFTATKSFTATNASYNMTAIAGGKFGTLMLPFAVTTLPGKAYSLDQGVTYGGDIYATEVNAIAANSPVLVTAKGEYTATEAPVAATADDTYTNGELVGTYKAMTAEENTFVLQKHGDYVAFFMVKDTKPTVNPFRAYIKAQNGAASKEFVNVIFDGNTTGISNVNNQGNAANDIIYDLSGRRVNNARKGVYIINGKKIVK